MASMRCENLPRIWGHRVVAGSFPATCLKSAFFRAIGLFVSPPRKMEKRPVLLFAEWFFQFLLVFWWNSWGRWSVFFHSQIRCFLVSSVFCTAQEACMEQIRDGPWLANTCYQKKTNQSLGHWCILLYFPCIFHRNPWPWALRNNWITCRRFDWGRKTPWFFHVRLGVFFPLKFWQISFWIWSLHVIEGSGIEHRASFQVKHAILYSIYVDRRNIPNRIFHLVKQRPWRFWRRPCRQRHGGDRYPRRVPILTFGNWEWRISSLKLHVLLEELDGYMGVSKNNGFSPQIIH